MPLVLRPRDGLSTIAAVDLAGITPDRLSGLDAATIERLGITVDGASRALAEVFVVSGTVDSDQRIECQGDFSRFDNVGAGMRAGTIVVAGSVGRRAAAGMCGGLIRIEGDAGDDAAAALPGLAIGMTGGLVVIAGSVGRFAAARMRRGIVAIGGNCGAGAGFGLRAGTLLVAGTLGGHAGLGMRRGSIIALGPAPAPGPTFLRGATWTPPFLALLQRRLAAAGFPAAGATGGRGLPPGCEPWSEAPWTQWHGDSLEGSRGELWLRALPSQVS